MRGPASLLCFLSLSLLLLLLRLSDAAADSRFEGFEAEEDDVVEETIDPHSFKLTDLPLTRSDSPSEPISDAKSENFESSLNSNPDPQESELDSLKPPSTTTTFDYWDEDEFEGLPIQPPMENPEINEYAPAPESQSPSPEPIAVPKKRQSYTVEIMCISFLIMFVINYFTRKREYEISFEVYMNDDAMDHVVFALARKKAAKGMQKELRDLQRFAGILAQPPNGKKWVSDELAVISESKEVAGDFITEAVLEQVFGEKAFEKYGKGFISMHFSDQHPETHKKMLLFKFALPDADNMADMTRLVALIPYYIDLIGRYKLSSQARSKTEAARQKAAQEAYKELQNARQEALQRKKAERRKLLEEAEAKLSAEAKL